MFDFFDEDFPLTKKQEDELKKREAEEAEAALSAAEEVAETAVETVVDTVLEPAEEAVADAAATVEEMVEETVKETVGESVEKAVDEVAEKAVSAVDEAHDEVAQEYDQPKPTITDLGNTVHDDVDYFAKGVSGVSNGETVENLNAYVEEAVESLPEVVENVENTSDSLAKDIEKSAWEAIESAEEAVDAAVGIADIAVDTVTEEAAEIAEEPATEVVEVAEETVGDAADAIENSVDEVIPEAAEYAEMLAGGNEIAAEPEQTGSYDEWSTFENEPETAAPAANTSIDDIEAHLHAELKSLGEKLDSMEKVVDGMEDGELPEGFEYEYDEQWYAEEETPAYKHPELHSAKKPETQKQPIVPAKKPSSRIDISVDLKTVAKAGAAVAAAAVLYTVFKKKKD